MPFRILPPSKDWKERYDKKKRPEINELKDYFNDEVFGLFKHLREI